MSRKAARPNSVRSLAPKPTLPQHEHPVPFSRLMAFEEEEDPEVYAQMAAGFSPAEIPAAVEKLTEMTLDESYYDYADPRSQQIDSRANTPYHALHLLIALGPAAAPAMERLFPLFASEDDWLREDLPSLYAAIGQPAIEPLTRLLLDSDAETYLREGAGSCLAEIGEKYPDLRPSVIALLEQALVREKEDEELVAYLICNLMDLGSKESVPLIEQAFQENRVDWTVVEMADVEEHFGLPRVTPYRSYDFGEDEDTEELYAESGLFSGKDEEDDEEPVQQPYIAPVKVGRNEPCPCGSGKKYKKCHGA